MKIVARNIFTLLLLLSIGNGVAAQNKIGIVYSNEIIKLMPETRQADSILKKFQDSLTEVGKKLEEHANKVIQSFGVHSGPPSFTREQLIKLVQEVLGFGQLCEDLTRQKSKELSIPVKNKFKDLVRRLAAENGYDYVLDFSDEHIGFLPLPTYDNITALVVRELNL